MRKRHFALAAILLIFGLSSCTWNNIEDLNLNANCETDSVTYSGDISVIMKTYCTSADFGDCHQSATDQPDLTDHTGVFSQADNGRIEREVFDNNTMPPSDSKGPLTLSLCEQEQLKAWLDAGAPDN